MKSTICKLQPTLVWKYFVEISQIPRVSGNERAIADYLVGVFKQLNAVDVYRDSHHNVIAHFRASHASCKNHSVITLHAHSDMVGAKEHGCKHDFLKDPISLRRVKDYVHADRTTLGADDGIGMAMILAVVTDPKIKHGPIEVVITTDEEMGQTGVNFLDKTRIKGKHLISLDGYDDREIIIGSASIIAQEYEIPVITAIDAISDIAPNQGGNKHTALSRLINVGKNAFKNIVNIKNETVKTKSTALSLVISNLCGGHVAFNMSVPQCIGNAIREVFYILHLISKNIKFNVVKIHGGESTHSIATSCSVTILVNDHDVKIVHQIFNERAEFLKKNFKGEKNAHFNVYTIEHSKSYISTMDSNKVVNFINSIYSGVTSYDQAFSVYNACSYIGTIKYDAGDNVVRVSGGSRTLTEQETKKEASRVDGLCELLDIKYRSILTAQAWTPNFTNNPLAKFVLNISNKKLPKTTPARITYTLGGCETAKFISSKDTNFHDAILWGPVIEHMHSPKERVNIESVSRCFNILCEVVKKL